MRVAGVGSVDTPELEARAAPYVSHENDAWLRVQVPQLLAIPEMLHVLGATADPATATFRLEAADGTRVSLDLSALTTLAAAHGHCDRLGSGAAAAPAASQRELLADARRGVADSLPPVPPLPERQRVA